MTLFMLFGLFLLLKGSVVFALISEEVILLFGHTFVVLALSYLVILTQRLCETTHESHATHMETQV